MDFSQSFSCCTCAIPQLVHLAGDGATPWWIDVGKTVVGAFVGAGLAFVANYYWQDRQRKSDQKLAGNIALLTMSRQYGDFVVEKATFLEEIRNAELNSIPSWRAIKPTMFEFDASLHFDFNSLAYLVEDDKDTLLAKLIDIENRYHDLRKILAAHSKAAAQLQRKFSELGWGNNLPDDQTVRKAVGFDLAGELDSLTNAIRKRIENHENAYVAAGKLLEQHMNKKFTKGVFIFKALGVKPGYSILDRGTKYPVAVVDSKNTEVSEKL
jgi:hypothetical protein